MLELDIEDVAKFHENIAKWFRNKAAAQEYAEYPHLHTGLCPVGRHRTMIEYTRQPGDDLQYGVEIELDLPYTDLMVASELRRGLAAGVKQCLWKFGLLKHGINIERDSSLKEGIEVVLPPMPVHMLQKVLQKLYTVHGMHLVRNHEDCGIHITTDKFPDEASAVAFWNFWQNPKLYDSLYGIIGRKPTKYCEIQGFVDTTAQMKQFKERGAVAMRENGCMEVRVFHSLMSARQVTRQVKLVDMVYKLCVKYKSEVGILPLVKRRFKRLV